MKKLIMVGVIISVAIVAYAGSLKERLKAAREQKAGNSKSASVSAALRQNRIKKNVVEFYMTTWCPYCRKMERFMKENNISFYTYDIEKDAEAFKRYKNMGGEGVPMLKVNDVVIRGYDTQGLLYALE